MQKKIKQKNSMSSLVQNIIRFGLILGIQIFLLNFTELHNLTVVWGVSLFKPFFYLLFILMLPSNLSKWATLIICFIVGFIIDKFTQSSPAGLHESACVLIGLVRPFILGLFFHQQIKDSNKPITPSLSKMGFKNFFTYIFIIIGIFIFYFFVIEFWSFKLNDILKMLLKIVSCLFTTLVLVILSQVLFIDTGKTKRRM
jgi:rod shape-determining protein MreD